MAANSIELVALGTIALGGVKNQRIVNKGEKFTLEDGKEAKWMVDNGAARLAAEPVAEQPKGAQVIPTPNAKV